MLKLIKEAQTFNRLGKQASLAQTVQSILGANSLTSIYSIFENFDAAQYQITPEDYQKWMEVLQAEAMDRGANLSKKRDFEDLAHLMFENDPRIDELGLDDSTVQQIVSTMWASYKASKAHGAVQRGVEGAVQRAREEEEMAAAATDPNQSALGQAVNQAQENEEKTASWKASFKGGGKMNPYPKGSLRHNLWNDVNHASEDEEFDSDSTMDDAVGHDEHELNYGDQPALADGPNGNNLADRVDDLEARVAGIEADEQEEPDHQEDGFDEESEREPNSLIKREPLDQVEDEETTAKKMFHKVLTSPRDQVNAALKDIESEGRTAWSGMQLPKNPHPKKSQAYNAWAKSFKGAAKEALGIVDKPATPAKKKR